MNNITYVRRSETDETKKILMISINVRNNEVLNKVPLKIQKIQIIFESLI